MDFSVIFQLRTKKFWWMDVIFYFVISLLIATILCYLIFLIKNNWQRDDIKKETVALETVGTDQQKEEESSVIGYQKKIADFSELFKNHDFASNVFGFMQTQTMPNVWFKQFNLDKKGGVVQLSGESDGIDALSRQVSLLEQNKYVKNIGNISSSLGESARSEFTTNITLSQDIFSYLSDMKEVLEPVAVVPPLPPVVPGGAELSSEKLITSFHLLLIPEVAGTVDQANYEIALNVPYGTNVKELTPSIVISSEATVSPASNDVQDFTNPVNYTVVAQDGSTQSYNVVVNVLPQAGETSGQPKSSLLIVIIIIIAVVAVTGGVIFFAWKKFRPAKTQVLK